MRVGVFHPGTQHSWQTALGFQEAGLLGWYATSAFYDPARWPYKLERYVPQKMSERLNREFRRRHNAFLDADKVRQFGLWEWGEVLLRRIGQQRMSEQVNVLGNRDFCQQTIKLIEREPVDLIWGYNSSSLEVFEWARKRGVRCVLDQTIGHPATQNQVLLQEQERHPEFFIKAYRVYDQEWIDRQNAEVSLADLVVTGSDSCARTLIENGCPAKKVRVVNYGYDSTLFPTERPKRGRARDEAIKLLFVGEVGPRKGIAYLLQAVANLPAEKVQLTLVGNLAIPIATFNKYASRVIHLPQVPRSEVARFFIEADCFVFPSLFEGSALVLYEAIGAGLGVIQTEQSGKGAKTGQNGLVLQDASVSGLLEGIQQVVNDPILCERWQANSWANRHELMWGGYRQRIAKLALDLHD